MDSPLDDLGRIDYLSTPYYDHDYPATLPCAHDFEPHDHPRELPGAFSTDYLDEPEYLVGRVGYTGDYGGGLSGYHGDDGRTIARLEDQSSGLSDHATLLCDVWGPERWDEQQYALADLLVRPLLSNREAANRLIDISRSRVQHFQRQLELDQSLDEVERINR
ncbi:hypothetical protein JCM11491_004279 [Sporobolomyces phaffii]